MVDTAESPQDHKQAGNVYGPVLSAFLMEENKRKASIEQRAFAVISTAGALISLILAIAALVLGSGDVSALLTPLAVGLLIAAIVMFVVSAIIGLLTNSPRKYRTYSEEDIKRMLSDWKLNYSDAQFLVAQLQAQAVSEAVVLNNKKAQLMQLGIATTVLGVALVGAAVVGTLVAL